MKVTHIKYPLPSGEYIPAVAAIGYFDGIHQGHKGVIGRAIERARAAKLPSCVITFDPHPREVLRKEINPSYLTPLQDKLEILHFLGVDLVYVIHFTQQFSQLSPQEFIDLVLYPLEIKEVVVGFDFRFGKGGTGTTQLLQEYCDEKLHVEIIKPINHNGQKISSSLIRQLIKEGHIEEANHYLVRPFRLRGHVVSGARRGRLLGFPTANLTIKENYPYPANGVYGVRVYTDLGSYDGVMNIGIRPTFSDSEKNPTIEIHLFNFSGDLYNTEVKADVLFHIRSEKKFNDIEELKKQIGFDIQFAKEKFMCYT